MCCTDRCRWWGRVQNKSPLSRNFAPSIARTIERLDITTGEREPWRTPRLADARGVVFVTRPVVAAGGGRYAYSYLRIISNLYLVEGLGE